MFIIGVTKALYLIVLWGAPYAEISQVKYILYL